MSTLRVVSKQICLLFGLLVLSITGCSWLQKQPSSQDRLLQARELASQATELTQQQRWTEAESLFAEATELAPEHDRGHAEYARVLWQQGQPRRAIERMRKATGLAPQNSQYRIELGQFYLSAGDTDAALVQAQKAVELNLPKSGSATAYALRGDIYRRQGAIDAALADYHQVLSIQPAYPRIELAIAEIYLARQRPQRALAVLTVLHQRTAPEHRSRRLLRLEAAACKQLARQEDAVQLLVTAVESGPPDADLFFELAEAQWLAGQPENAGLVLRQALSLAPEHAACLRLQREIQSP